MVQHVAHHPDRHPYVDAVCPIRARVSGVFDVDALIEAGVSCVHLHFGLEQLGCNELGRWIDALDAAGIDLVHTVHDIDNPHLVDQRPHHGRLRLLIERSRVVITLTGAAANVIAARWGRVPEVIEHPPLHEALLAEFGPHHRGTGDRVTWWLGAVRTNCDQEFVARQILASPTSDHGTDVLVRRDGRARLTAGVLDAVEIARRRGDDTRLLVIERPSDRDLVRRIAHTRVLVLPYSHGTHSGLVALARSLGTPVVVPDVGCHASQGAIMVHPSDLDGAAATIASAARAPLWSAAPVDRGASARRQHRRLYESLEPRSVARHSRMIGARRMNVSSAG